MMPKVSLIMPACYGRMAAVAIKCFQNQTYSNLELVVLDNNIEGETIQDLLPADDPRIVYVRCDKAPVGALRNQGTALATGEIICTWDCDDW